MRDIPGVIVSVVEAAMTFLVLFPVLPWSLLVGALLCLGVYAGVLLPSTTAGMQTGTPETVIVT